MSRLVLFVLPACLMAASSARAGLYHTTEWRAEEAMKLPSGKRAPFLSNGGFRDTLVTLRAIGSEKVEKDSTLRKRYMLDEGMMYAPAAKLSVEQKLNLGAVLVRRKKFDAALEVLRPLAAEERSNFLVLSNLANAYLLSGPDQADQLDRAYLTLSEALDCWPKKADDIPADVKALTEAEFPYERFRRAEGYLKSLIRLRRDEARKQKPGESFQSVDALFDDGKKPPTPVKFVGESGEFEPGKIAAAEKAKLPADAVEIVEQLLVWMPDDLRLYWLLGELLNAQGDVAGAKQIFGELVQEKVRARDVLHRNRELEAVRDEDNSSKALDSNPLPDKKPPDQAQSSNLRPLVVGFATGLLVGIFAVWQFREMRRRRMQRV